LHPFHEKNDFKYKKVAPNVKTLKSHRKVSTNKPKCAKMLDRSPQAKESGEECAKKIL
jgi:hypothetical protein